MQKEYQRIDCHYYDELEAIATLRKKVTILYETEEGPATLEAVGIQDLFAKNKEEFVKLSNGLILRLDYLLEVNGKTVVKAG